MIAAAALAISLAVPTHAQTPDPSDAKYATIDEASIENALEKTESPKIVFDPVPLPRESTGVTIDAIVRIGKLLWEIVVANKPVVNVRTQYWAAIPAGVSRWDQLAGWSTPQAEIYRLTAKNLYGMTVVDVHYSILRSYGGSYEGRGKYLTGVTVEPTVTVRPGFTFSMSAEAPEGSIVNAGTRDDPVAAMNVIASWRIESVVTVHEGRKTFHLRGDGTFRELGK